MPDKNKERCHKCKHRAYMNFTPTCAICNDNFNDFFEEEIMPDKKIERKCDNCNNKCNETNLFIDNDLCVNCIRDFHTNMYPDEAPVDNFTQKDDKNKERCHKCKHRPSMHFAPACDICNFNDFFEEEIMERKCDNCENQTGPFSIAAHVCITCIRFTHWNKKLIKGLVDNFIQRDIKSNKKDIPSLMSQILAEIDDELKSAMENHPTWHSNHEAIGVIREEYLELEAEIFKLKECYKANDEMKAEAIQLAAMAIRFILDMYYK